MLAGALEAGIPTVVGSRATSSTETTGRVSANSCAWQTRIIAAFPPSRAAMQTDAIV